MDVGIGLPNGVPGTTGEQLLEVARRSEARGFSSLGAIDRLGFQCYEPLATHTAAAAVTEGIGLCTSVLLVSGVDRANRGARLDSMLEQMEATWANKEIGPPIAKRPRVIVGGLLDASLARAARFGDGWIAGGTPPGAYSEMAAKLDEAWSRQGRTERPHKMMLAYYSLGPEAEEKAFSYLTAYYGWLGEEVPGRSPPRPPRTRRPYRATPPPMRRRGATSLFSPRARAIPLRSICWRRRPGSDRVDCSSPLRLKRHSQDS